MFEKEAEEYQIRKHHQRLYGHKPVVMKELNTTFKDGAEFGYNKGKSEAKEIIKQLIDNAPNTYSGTDIELQQKKMFSFQNAVNKAEQFLKETE